MKRTHKISATKFSRSARCSHYFYLEYYGDKSFRRDETDAEKNRFLEGSKRESEVVNKIKQDCSPEEFQAADWVFPDFEHGYKQTVQILSAGPVSVYQGVLIRRDLLGVPDLLQRIEGKSLLGNFSYIPVDIKNHKKTTKDDLLQLFFYAYLLEPILGHRPQRGSICLNNDTVDEIEFDKKLEQEFFENLDVINAIDQNKSKTVPVQCSLCGDCRWYSLCNDYWKETDDLSLMEGSPKSLIQKLAPLGITTCRKLSQLEPEVLMKEIKMRPDQAIRLISSAKAKTENRTVMLKEPKFPKDLPIYYYDIETFGDTVIVQGVIRSFEGQREEKCFIANTPEEEGLIWHEFLAYLSQDDDAIVYCWATHEGPFVKKCWDRYGGNSKAYEMLNKRLVDQCAFAKDHFTFPCRGYSIKDVAPTCGFNWQADDAGGLNCVEWYRGWLETGNQDLYNKIKEYNLDDVRAMEVIDAHLKQITSDHV